MKRVYLITMLLSLVVLFSRGQTTSSNAPLIPTSPQAQAIKQHGDIEINYSQGIPDVSIPLFEIDHHGYKLPVSLKYYPATLKLGYNYDVFGHGWSLSVNSCISRSIRYAPDELKYFKLVESSFMEKYYKDYSNEIGYYNFEYDSFNVTLPDGSSFDLIIKNKGDVNNTLEYIVSNGRNIKMECQYSVSNISSFIITDENGVKYTFSGGDSPINATIHASYYVSWQLIRIDLPNAPDAAITFNYNQTIQSSEFAYYEKALSFMHHKRASVGGSIEEINNVEGKMIPDANYYSYRMKLLSSIQYGSSSISLHFQNSGVATRNYVTNIRVFDHTTLKKNINLGFDKWTLSAPGASTTDSVAQLSSVKIMNPQLSHSTEEYSCTYQGGYFGFAGTDHWGNLNAYNQQQSLGAKFNMFTECDPSYYHYLGSTNSIQIPKASHDLDPYYKIQLTPYDARMPDHPNRHGVLDRITYPTGGYTEFIFENNRCLTATDADGNYIHNMNMRPGMNAGGFRINKISNYTAQNTVAGTRCFRYGPLESGEYSSDEAVVVQPYADNHTGVGEAVADPNILTYSSFASLGISNSDLIRYMLVGLSPNGVKESFVNPFVPGELNPWESAWECTVSPSNFRRLLDGRPSVIYPEVTVYEGDIDSYSPGLKPILGKTVFTYDVYDLFSNGSAFFERPEYNKNTLYYEPQKYRYGNLKEKRDYLYTDGGFLLKRKEKNSYAYRVYSMYDYTSNKAYPNVLNPLYATINEFFIAKTRSLGVSLPSSKSVTTYEDSSDAITEYEDYGYNLRSQLNSKRISASGYTDTEAWKEIKMTYPEMNTGGSTPAIIQKMVENNIISPVIESLTFDNNNLVSGIRTDYDEYALGSSTAILPARKLALEFKPEEPEYALQGEVLKYSPSGNPLEYELKGGRRSVYLWGYNDRYMIAEIKNASYAAVAAALVQLGINNIQSQIVETVSPDMNIINQLRQQLPEAQISTYVYNPLVGMTSAADPKGLVTSYSYDEFGRLKEIRDNEGNILGAYTYHYKTDQ